MKSGALTGRRVLITGGSAGIGLATVETLLENDCSVFYCGRRRDRVEGALAKLRQRFDAKQVGASVCDVRSEGETEALTAAAAAHLGGIDALVNSAGVATIRPFSELSAASWQEMIDTNLTGVFHCCKAALPWLKRSDRADIVNLGSRSGRYAYAGGTAYGATKAGLQAFSEALFLDLVDDGIGVSLVAPGTVATDLVEDPNEDWHLRPTDVAEVIADVLASDRRSNLNWIEMRPSKRDARR